MAQAHKINPVVIREYDVRGTVDKNLFIADAAALGRAFGTRIIREGGKTVSVGFDGRVSSPAMEKALVEGLMSTGLHVYQIGLCPTPMLYFSTFHLDADAGIMVTGSHNPPDQNGFKMVLSKKLKNGGAVYGKQIVELAALSEKGDLETGSGKTESVDVSDAYILRLLKDYEGKKNLKVVWDNGNGSAGNILARLVKKLPGEHIILFGDVDGNFPNHHPDPTVDENLVDLQKAVREHKADLGIAFDGDADRIGAVDSQARILVGDQLLALYARDVLKALPGSLIIGDIRASQVLFDDIASHGGQPLMWIAGHSHIKAKMALTKAPLAGEMSGHIFWADKYYGFDDAVYSGVRLMSMIASGSQSLAQLKDTLAVKKSTPEVRFAIDESRKFQVVEEVKARLKTEGANFTDIDGVRVSTKDGWWLLRASNTSAMLTARIESETNEGLARLKDAFIAQLKASNVTPPAI